MKSSVQHFDTVVLSSSMGGLGAAITAAEQGRRVLLIEAGTIAGHDFVETLQMHRGWALPQAGPDAQPVSAAAIALHADATRRKIIRDVTCDTAAFSCLLQERLAQCGATALYMTDLIGVTRTKAARNGFSVQFSNRSGISTVTTERLVDATPDASGLRALDALLPETAPQGSARWSYRGLMIALEKIDALPVVSGPDLALTAGRYGTDAILELFGTGPVPGIAAARIALVERVARLRTEAAWKIFSLGTTANAVAHTPKVTVRAGVWDAIVAAGFQTVAAWRTPALADQPWAAFEAGAAAVRPVAALAASTV